MNQKQVNKQQAYRFKRFLRKAYSAFNSMHRLVNIGVVTGCALTCLHVSLASAQTTSNEQQQKVMEKELDEVMVTASRVEMPINQTAKLVTVITKEQIEQAPVQSIQDLLVYAANIDVIQRGGHGVQADISIRGGTFDQNAVLLNGVNLSNPPHRTLQFRHSNQSFRHRTYRNHSRPISPDIRSQCIFGGDQYYYKEKCRL